MSKRILIAEDSPNTRQILKFMLESKGYEVIEAVDGEEAWEKVGSEHPDLVVLDGMMPKMTGFEVAKKLRDDPQLLHLPIVVVSAIAMDNEHSGEYYRLKLLADEFVTKPFKVHDLTAKIIALVNAPRPSSGERSEGTQTRRRMGSPF